MPPQEVSLLPSIGEITVDIALNVPEAEVKRALDRAEAATRSRLTVPVGIDTAALEQGTRRVRSEVEATTRATVQASREQAAASRAAAAESAANAARIREQAAQLAFTARMGAQASRDEANAARIAYQARREAIDGVRLSMARLRAEFDDGLKSQGAYQAENQRLINQLRAMGERADFTARELKQIADLQARLAREGNTVAGVINPAGLSGNVATALAGVLPGLLAGLRQVAVLSPSLGAAAAQVSGVAQGLQSVRVAAQGVAPATLQVGQGLNTAGQAAGFLRTGAAGAGAAINGVGVAAGFAGVAFGTLAVGAAAAGAAINGAANEYARFETGLAQVATLTDKTTAQLGGTGRAILKLSAETGATFQDLNRGLYDVLGAGVQGTEDMTAAMGLLRTATMLAKAGATNAAVATDVLTSVLNAFKLTAGDAGRVSDQLFQAVKDGKVTFDQLAQSLGAVLPVAAQAGVGLDEVLASVAAMTAQGIQPSSAVEYLRSALSNIIKPSEQAANTAKDLGLQFDAQALKAKGLTGFLQDVVAKTKGNSEAMSRLFGDIGGVTAVLALASGEFGRLKQALDGQAGSAGATGQAYGKMADTISNTSDRVAAKFKAISVSIGEVFAPTKLAILKDIEEMLNKADELLQKFLAARRLNTANTDVDRLRRGITTNEAALARSRATLNDPNASEFARGRAAYDIPRYEKTLRELRADLDAAIQSQKDVITANRAGATSNLTPNQQGARLPGDNTTPAANIPDEAGKFGLAYISALKDVFVNDPKVASDCAVIASAILKNLGVNIKGSANARTLEQNAIKAGFEKVDGSEVKPGDLIVWTSGNGKTYGAVSGKHVGVAAGYKNGQLQVIENPGSANTQVVPIYDRQNATYYRAPTSPFAASPPPPPPPSDEAAKNRAALQRDIDTAVAAGRIEAARRTLVELKRLQDEELEGARDNAAKRAQIVSATGPQILAAEAQIAARVRNQAIQAAAQFAKEARGKEGTDPQVIEQERRRRVGEAYAVEAQALRNARSEQARANRTADEQAAKDEETRAKNRTATQLALSKALTEGRQADAARLLERLKTAQAEELALYKEDAGKRAQIIQSTGPAILDAENRVANLRRDARVKEAQRVADEAGKLPGADLAAIEQTRRSTVSQAYRDAAAERARARTGQRAAERVANEADAEEDKRRAKEQRDLRARIADERRQLTEQLARQELTRTEELNRQELAASRATGAARLALIKRQAEDEYQARLGVARATRDRLLRESANKDPKGTDPNRGTRDRAINADFDVAELAARGTRDAATRQEQEAQAQTVRGLRDEYSQLVTGIREKIAAGKVETADVNTLLVALTDLEARTNRVGQASSKYLVPLRDTAAALYQQAVEAQIAAGAFDGMVDGHNRAAQASRAYTVTLEDALAQIPLGTEATEAYVRVLEDLAAQGRVSRDVLNAVKGAVADRTSVWAQEAEQIQRVTEEATENADALVALGDSEGAVSLLGDTLGGLYDRMERGEDVAAAIGLVTARINELGEALRFDADFSTFIAGLSGTLSDQIDALALRLTDDTLSPALRARLTAYLSDLRAQIGQAYTGDPYTAGFIPNTSARPGQGPDYQTLARARDLLAELEGPSDPGATGPTAAQLQGTISEITDLLASEVGQKLPEATRAGLEAGVRGAQEYIATLASITADGVEEGTLDGRDRVRNAAPPPQNQFGALLGRVTTDAATADPATLAGLTDSLNTARAAGELTANQLEILLALVERLSTDAGRLGRARGEVDALKLSLGTGQISLEDFAGQAGPLSERLERLGAAAERAGNPKLAGEYRDLAVALRTLLPVLPGVGREFESLGDKVNRWADYASQVASGFEQIGNSLGDDLGANIAGFGKALGTAAGIAKDIVAGNYLGAAIKLFTTLADALGGFQKANRQAIEQQKQFNKQFTLINGDDYAKTFVRSRGLLADLFGGGPEVKQEINEFGLTLARAIEGGVVNGLKSGLKQALMTGDWSGFQNTFRESAYSGVVDGIVEAIFNKGLQEILAPGIKALTSALETESTADDASAYAEFERRLLLGERYATEVGQRVQPGLDRLRENLGITPGQGGAGNPGNRDLFGAAPGAQLGIPRIEVTFPAEALRPLTEFGLAVPEFRAGVAEWRQLTAEMRTYFGRMGGPPPLSGNGGLVV